MLLAGGLLVTAIFALGCGDNGSQKTVLPPPPKPVPRKKTPKELTGILLPKTARYDRFAEEKPGPTREGTVLLARFDLPADDLDELGERNPHLPDVAKLNEQKDLLLSVTGLETTVSWWQPERLHNPRCAWHENRKIPLRPAAPDPDADDEGGIAPEPDNRTWSVTMCVGDIEGGRVRVYILFVEHVWVPVG